MIVQAFSTASYARCCIQKIYPLNLEMLPNEIQNPEFIRWGANEQKPEGFDFGNSPSTTSK